MTIKGLEEGAASGARARAGLIRLDMATSTEDPVLNMLQAESHWRSNTGIVDADSNSDGVWDDFRSLSPSTPRLYRSYAPSTASSTPSPCTSAGPSPSQRSQGVFPALQPLAMFSEGASGPQVSCPLSKFRTVPSNCKEAAWRPGSPSPTRPSLGSKNWSNTWISSATKSPSISDPAEQAQNACYCGSISPEEHTRSLSLTSACPPMGSVSPSKDASSYHSISTSVLLSPRETLKKRAASKPRWRPFPWLDGTVVSTDESKRRGTIWQEPRSRGQRQVYEICRCLSGHIRRLCPSLIASQKSPSRTKSKRKRWSLVARWMALSYVLFSIYYLTASLIGHLDSDNGQQALRRTTTVESPAWHAARGKPPLKAEVKQVPMQPRRSNDTIREEVPSAASVLRPYDLDVPPRPHFDNRLEEYNSTTVLSSMSHRHRFSKLSAKLDKDWHDQVEPFFVRAEDARNSKVTACLYYNAAWLELLVEFAERWPGPISVVYEVLGQRNSTNRQAVLDRLTSLRKRSIHVSRHVDFHVVFAPQASEVQHRRARERLITRPVGTNFHLNLARLFAKTDLVWLVSDSRILPSAGLHSHLEESTIVSRLSLGEADAVVIPLFGAHRTNLSHNDLSSLERSRQAIGLARVGHGVAANEFDRLAASHVDAHLSSPALARAEWPHEKPDLVAAVDRSLLGLHDRHWEVGNGPTHFDSWRNANASEVLDEAGLIGLRAADRGFYQVAAYDSRYNPSLVVGKDQQPWCTERFEYHRAVCSYQMYLQGAKMWVLPDQWAYTLESVDGGPKAKKHESDRLKAAIASRLYAKFHVEACMHYARAFLSMGMWNEERAQQLRHSCSQVLKSNGIGKSAAGRKEV